MRTPKRLRTIDDRLLLHIETAVAKGANSNANIAKAIGWTAGSFKNYRYGKKGTDKYQPFSAPIEAAIKRGYNRRTEVLLSMGEDAVAELLRHGTYMERHQTRKQIPKRRRNANGKWEDYIEEITEQRIVEKQRVPNPIIAMFVVVNASQNDSTKRNIGWKSINHVAGKMVADEGAIMRRIDVLVEPDSEESTDSPPAKQSKAEEKKKS